MVRRQLLTDQKRICVPGVPLYLSIWWWLKQAGRQCCLMTWLVRVADGDDFFPIIMSKPSAKPHTNLTVWHSGRHVNFSSGFEAVCTMELDFDWDSALDESKVVGEHRLCFSVGPPPPQQQLPTPLWLFILRSLVANGWDTHGV
jgi:hypothetical protein